MSRAAKKLAFEVFIKDEIRVKENIQTGSGVADVFCGGQQESQEKKIISSCNRNFTRELH